MQARLEHALEASKKYSSSALEIFKKLLPPTITLTTLKSYGVVQAARGLDESVVKDAIKTGASSAASWVNLFATGASTGEYYAAMLTLAQKGVWQYLSKPQKAILITAGVLNFVGSTYAFIEFGAEQHTLAAILMSLECELTALAGASAAGFFTRNVINPDQNPELPITDPDAKSRLVVSATGSYSSI